MTPALAQVRADFPALACTHEGQPLIYLDNAATSLKPASVIEAISSSIAADGNALRGWPGRGSIDARGTSRGGASSAARASSTAVRVQTENGG